MNISAIIAQELGVNLWQVEAVIKLLEEGCTIPFIARYRKELHGEMTDEQLRTLSERLGQLQAVADRREAIVESLKKLEKWTEELQAELDRCQTLAQLEDVYRPYRPKRRTRASAAREKGLEPLADLMLLQRSRAATAEELAQPYVQPELGVNSAEEALNGAQPRRARTRTPSTSSTLTTASRCAACLPTGCWRSTGARRRARSRLCWTCRRRTRSARSGRSM